MKNIFFSVMILISSTVFGQITKIYTIQGSGTASPLVSQTVTTEGVVFADFQAAGQLNGYYIQDTIGDGNPATSDGIFIYHPSGLDVSVGDFVTVTGQVLEYFGLTEIGSVTNVVIEGTVTNMISPVQINLPVTSIDDMEAFEGMYVEFPQNLTVTDQYNLGKFGEFTLADNRQIIPTNIIDPNDDPASGTTNSGSSNVASVNAMIDLNTRSRILVDDGRTGSYPNPIPYIDPTERTLRAGSTVQNIRGAMSYGFGKYRLMPTIAPVFNYAQRPAIPLVGGDITVASFNVLNFFTTIDDGSNGARGADSPSEYVRQRDKIVAALDSMRADIYALIEIENNGTTAADSLVDALNTSIGSPVYALVTESPFTGSYAIKNVFIYNTNTITPLDTMMTSTDVLFYPPPIAHQFEVNATGGKFNLFANHYRYKGCDDATGADLDQLDGQGCYNETRRQQSFELLNFISYVEGLNGNSDHLIVGDFNAYEQEDPIDIFVGSGYVKLIDESYSFAYMNEFGSLDHAFASADLNAVISGAEIWHINSDEPLAADYNEESVVDDLYEVNPYRSSDHDPVLIGLSPDHSVGIFEDDPFNISAFPNPFTGQMIIQSEELVDICISDMMGRILQTISSVKGNYVVNTENISSGMIFVTFYKEGKQVAIRRLVKQ